MKAQFVDLSAAADFHGPGAVEINRYQTEITDIVRRRGVFGQRIKQVPATGHPSRFFEETAIAVADGGQCVCRSAQHRPPTGISDARGAQRSAEGLVSQINYNLFDMEVGSQQSQFAYLQAKDLADAVEGLMRTHDVALWNGNDTSLSSPDDAAVLTARSGRSTMAATCTRSRRTDSIVDGLKSTVAQMVANSRFEVRPTAIYANPVLLDLIDREMKTEFNVVLSTTEVAAGLRVKTLSTQAGELPLIPEWSLAYTGTPGSGTAVLPCYIVSEDMIEYHWLTDPNPRVFQLGLTELAGVADGGGEVRRRRGEGRSYAHTK